MSLGDLIFNLGEWLRTTPANDWALAIQKTWLSGLIDRNFWVIPTIQTIHILAIAAAKMIMIIFAAAVSLWFQGSVRRNVAVWELTHGGRVVIRIGAGLVIAMWCLIMVLGRWIAYAPT